MYILEVNELYIYILRELIRECHSNVASNYIKSTHIGLKCGNCFDTEESMYFLSDILFYLENYVIGEDDVKELHKAKEEAMLMCYFKESDIRSRINGIFIYEDGLVILIENDETFLLTEITHILT